MKNEDTNEVDATETVTLEAETQQENEAQNGKLLLGKRVLRHFGVRSDVQAGSDSMSMSRRCR